MSAQQNIEMKVRRIVMLREENIGFVSSDEIHRSFLVRCSYLNDCFAHNKILLFYKYLFC